MKLVQSIFSIYLIILSCLPCTDMDTTISIHSSKEISSTKEKHSHDKTSDICSPFCVCNCCGGQGFTYNIDYNWNFVSVNAIIDKKTPEYKSIFTSNFYGSIWQPPQIA